MGINKTGDLEMSEAKTERRIVQIIPAPLDLKIIRHRDGYPYAEEAQFLALLSDGTVLAGAIPEGRCTSTHEIGHSDLSGLACGTTSRPFDPAEWLERAADCYYMDASGAYWNAAQRLTEEEWQERFGDEDRGYDAGWRCECGWVTDGDTADYICGVGNLGEHQKECQIAAEFLAATDLADRLNRLPERRAA